MPAEKNHKPRIFLSYADKDKLWARELALQLKNAGLRVWYPDGELYPGDNWPLANGKALESAQAMVVLVSPESAASEVILNDLSYALGSEKFRDKLIPVIVRPTSKMPWILKKMKPVKGSPRQVSTVIVDRLKTSGASAH